MHLGLALIFCGFSVLAPASERFTGYPAHLVENRLSARLQKRWLERGFEFVPGTAQCSAYLPILSNQLPLLGGLTQMRHTWIELGGKSYGMAYTLQHHYFGGKARIQSPDAFQKFKLWDVQCSPLLAPRGDSDFSRRARCVMKRLTRTKDYLVLNYHVFKHNCLAAVDWAVNCAGGKLSRLPNLGIGGDFGSSFQANFALSPNEVVPLDRICREIREDCE